MSHTSWRITYGLPTGEDGIVREVDVPASSAEEAHRVAQDLSRRHGFASIDHNGRYVQSYSNGIPS